MTPIAIIHDDKIRQWLTSVSYPSKGSMYVYADMCRRGGWQSWGLLADEIQEFMNGYHQSVWQSIPPTNQKPRA